MANKKFKRFITGILLSCNIASFSFCSANYDVLTENIANQSGSEQLKTLYIAGRKVQEHYAQNQSKIRKAKETATTLYNQSIEELDDLKAFFMKNYLRRPAQKVKQNRRRNDKIQV